MCRAASPGCSRSGRRGRSATGSARRRPATGCPSTTSRSASSTTTATPGCARSARRSRSPASRSKAPPSFVLKVLCRVHPELRRRARAAQRAIDRKLWHEDRLRWEQVGRAELLAAGPRPAGRADRAARRRRARRPPAPGRRPPRTRHRQALRTAPDPQPDRRSSAAGLPRLGHRPRRGVRPPRRHVAGVDSIGGAARHHRPSPRPTRAWSHGPSTTSAPPAPKLPPRSTTTSPTTAGGSSPSTRPAASP